MPTPDAALEPLAALLAADDVDAAIAGGLMTLDLSQATPGPLLEQVLAARQRLQRAWDARERHQAREARMARRTALARDRGTAPPSPAHPVATAPGAATAPTSNQASGLPTAAAAALARAQARARERSHP